LFDTIFLLITGAQEIESSILVGTQVVSSFIEAGVDGYEGGRGVPPGPTFIPSNLADPDKKLADPLVLLFGSVG
jgi:hypothetical protein